MSLSPSEVPAFNADSAIVRELTIPPVEDLSTTLRGILLSKKLPDIPIRQGEQFETWAAVKERAATYLTALFDAIPLKYSQRLRRQLDSEYSYAASLATEWMEAHDLELPEEQRREAVHITQRPRWSDRGLVHRSFLLYALDAIASEIPFESCRALSLQDFTSFVAELGGQKIPDLRDAICCEKSLVTRLDTIIKLHEGSDTGAILLARMLLSEAEKEPPPRTDQYIFFRGTEIPGQISTFFSQLNYFTDCLRRLQGLHPPQLYQRLSPAIASLSKEQPQANTDASELAIEQGVSFHELLSEVHHRTLGEFFTAEDRHIIAMLQANESFSNKTYLAWAKRHAEKMEAAIRDGASPEIRQRFGRSMLIDLCAMAYRLDLKFSLKRLMPFEIEALCRLLRPKSRLKEARASLFEAYAQAFHFPAQVFFQRLERAQQNPAIPFDSKKRHDACKVFIFDEWRLCATIPNPILNEVQNQALQSWWTERSARTTPTATDCGEQEKALLRTLMDLHPLRGYASLLGDLSLMRPGVDLTSLPEDLHTFQILEAQNTLCERLRSIIAK